MSNITRKEDFINTMTPGMRRDLLRALGLNNLYFVECYNKRFSPYYTISGPSISLALNDKNPTLLNFIADELIKYQQMNTNKVA